MRLSTRFHDARFIADKNHGLLTTADLKSCGFDVKQIRQLCDDGLIERIIRGLYRVRGTRSPLQDIAAALSRHSHAVASHRSAGFLHELVDNPGEVATFTLPPTATGRTSLGLAHRSPLDLSDITRRRRIPTTSVARTIVDLGECLSEDELAGVLNVAVSRRQVTISQIAEAASRVESQPGRSGHARLRRALAPWTEDIQPESPAEALAIRRIHDFGLPVPTTQHVVVDAEGMFVARVDLAWPEQRVIREYDSVLFHGPERVDADESRRKLIEAAGWSVGSITRADLRPGEVGWLTLLAGDLAGISRRAS